LGRGRECPNGGDHMWCHSADLDIGSLRGYYCKKCGQTKTVRENEITSIFRHTFDLNKLIQIIFSLIVFSSAYEAYGRGDLAGTMLFSVALIIVSAHLVYELMKNRRNLKVEKKVKP